MSSSTLAKWHVTHGLGMTHLHLLIIDQSFVISNSCYYYTFLRFPYLYKSSVKRTEIYNSLASIHTSVNRQPEMRSSGNAILKRWHGMLGLSRQSPPSWYRDRLREELMEHRIANTRWQKLSEASDVFFSCSRAQYDGCPVRNVPPFLTVRHVPVYVYMLVKFTSRWTFYRTAAIICKAPRYDLVREVVNPSKDRKLEEVASRHQIDPVAFKRVSRGLRRIWPLLP